MSHLIKVTFLTSLLRSPVSCLPWHIHLEKLPLKSYSPLLHFFAPIAVHCWRKTHNCTGWTHFTSMIMKPQKASEGCPAAMLHWVVHYSPSLSGIFVFSPVTSDTSSLGPTLNHELVCFSLKKLKHWKWTSISHTAFSRHLPLLLYPPCVLNPFPSCWLSDLPQSLFWPVPSSTTFPLMVNYSCCYTDIFSAS